MPLDVVILGPPGADKGTQAKRIAADDGIPHIATGDMLREAMAAGTELGKRVAPIYEAGDLVPDELMIGLIRQRLAREDTADGFLLDGFPRTLAQAEALDAMLEEIGRGLAIVLHFQLPEEVAMERLRGRAGREGRSDDLPDVIRRRLEVFRSQTETLVAYYRTKGILVTIHAERSIGEVHAEIQAALEQAARRPVRAGGPVEGARGNREVPPAASRRA